MSGVGWLRQTPDLVFQTAKRFEMLPTISDHFREVKYSEKTQRLFVVSQALGYQARMLFQLRIDEARRQIRFEVIEGHFLGLRGEIGVSQILPHAAPRSTNQTTGLETSKMTEMTVLMAHEARELPIPKILIGFALEIVAENVAQKMRRFLEAQ